MNKRLYIALLLISIMLTSVGCKKKDAEPVAPGVTFGIFQGKILSNSQPVEGATIRIGNLTPQVTGYNGIFKFDSLAVMSFQVTVTKAGYLTITGNITVTAGETQTQIYNLKKMSLPVIYSFTPSSGIIGTHVEISGLNFDPSDSVNIVNFGNHAAKVISATDNKIIVIAPEYYSLEPVRITVKVGEEIATSTNFFDLLYPWTQKKDFNLDRISASFSIGNMAYLIKENSTTMLSYNPDNDTWLNNINLPDDPGKLHFAYSIGNKAYVKLKNSFWEFDPSSNNWIRMADFPGMLQNDRRYWFGLAIGGNVFVGNCYNSSEFWEYYPVLNTWQRKADFPGNFAQSGQVKGNFSFSTNNKGFLGISQTESAINTLWEYTPELDAWTVKTPLPSDAFDLYCCFVINGVPFVGLGANNDPGTLYASRKIWKYDLQNDQWIQCYNCPYVMTSFASFSIHDKGYVVASYVNSDADPSHLWAYDPARN